MSQPQRAPRLPQRGRYLTVLGGSDMSSSTARAKAMDRAGYPVPWLGPDNPPHRWVLRQGSVIWRSPRQEAVPLRQTGAAPKLATLAPAREFEKRLRTTCAVGRGMEGPSLGGYDAPVSRSEQTDEGPDSNTSKVAFPLQESWRAGRGSSARDKALAATPGQGAPGPGQP